MFLPRGAGSPCPTEGIFDPVSRNRAALAAELLVTRWLRHLIRAAFLRAASFISCECERARVHVRVQSVRVHVHDLCAHARGQNKRSDLLTSASSL